MEWTSQTTEAFRALRGMLNVSVCLCVPCEADVFVLESDACAIGIGTVLSVRRGEELLVIKKRSHVSRWSRIFNFSTKTQRSIGKAVD